MNPAVVPCGEICQQLQTDWDASCDLERVSTGKVMP